MLDDAIYYSRREADERALAISSKDMRARQIHLLLAEKYHELAQRSLASLPENNRSPRLSAPAMHSQRRKASAPRTR